MNDIASGQVGAEGKYDIAFQGLDLVVSGGYVGKQLSGSLQLRLNGKAILEALKEAIPGKFDDAIINMIEALQEQQQAQAASTVSV